ncbi:MAG: AraC family transcriptional regulator [Synergistaceae bacterium]|jgi:AraC-like DNA-binding protein|nr:AraC family transcriptional regulator [Synergistaceae bacterium]
MEDNVENKLQLLSELSYWKSHLSVQDVLSSELSYSLIYDNILPDKVSDALATVGLTALPNRFFLIQVDDYQNHIGKMQVTQEFFQKTTLINMLRECMQTLGIQGFIANLVGLDRIICFLCCFAQEDQDASEYLLSVAEKFKKYVRTRSLYTISICISQQCVQLAQYSEMYPKMGLALSRSYFSDKEFSMLLEDVAEHTDPENAGVNLNEYFPELLASIARHNRAQFEQVQRKIIQTLLESQVRPQKAHLEIVRLMQRVKEYCTRCGVPETRILAYHEAAVDQILSCNFIADTRVCFQEYYERAAQTLEECDADVEYSFKNPVDLYIEEHYHETIRLGDMAEMIGFSEGHFARTFRKKFGMTFVRYLAEYRIQQSKKLLSDTQIPVEQIAYRVGINSYSYFCTCFKSICGLSPGSYRKQFLSQGRNE